MPAFCRILAVIGAVGWIQVSAPFAAEFSHTCESDRCTIQLKGEIVSGDAVRFSELLRNLNDAGGVVDELRLLSRGGDVSEALKIGRVVRDNFIVIHAPSGETYEPPLPENLVPGTQAAIDAVREWEESRFKYFRAITVDGRILTTSRRAVENVKTSGRSLEHDRDAMCASACALIAISGLYRFGTVGLHHMYVADEEIDYDSLDAILSQSKDDVAEYLAEMRAPRSFLDDIVSTPSKEIKWIDLFQIGPVDPVLEEYLYSKCGGLTKKQDSELFDLDFIERYGTYFDENSKEMIERTLTATERSYLNELRTISEASSNCKDAVYLDAQRKAQGIE